MAPLFEHLSSLENSSAGPIRTRRNQPSNRSLGPYSRGHRRLKTNVDSTWTHDLYEPDSLAARLTAKPGALKVTLNNIAQKALRDATASLNPGQLFIKGASTGSQRNVVEVSGLVSGTTADDVAAIFKCCGKINSSKSIPSGDDIRIRLTFKTPTAASAAVRKFHNQPADGKILSVRIVGSSNMGVAHKVNADTLYNGSSGNRREREKVVNVVFMEIADGWIPID